MEYVVLYQGRVIWGPREWNPLSIENAIEFQSGASNVTIGPDPVVGVLSQLQDFVILRVESEEIPPYDAIFETIEGPFYSHNVPNGTTTIRWNAIPDNVAYVMGKIKQQVEAKRYQKETEGIDIEIDEVSYRFPTDREQRSRLIIQSVSNESVLWKNAGAWISMSPDQLADVVRQINAHVQKWFTWEKTGIDILEACETLDQIKQAYESIIEENR